MMLMYKETTPMQHLKFNSWKVKQHWGWTEKKRAVFNKTT